MQRQKRNRSIFDSAFHKLTLCFCRFIFDSALFGESDLALQSDKISFCDSDAINHTQVSALHGISPLTRKSPRSFED